MKAAPIPIRLRRALRRGYTLMELSLAMGTGLMIAAMLLAIFNQQVAFLKIFNKQSFLTTEAPIINNYLSRVIGSAEGYRLYADMGTLERNGPAVQDGARVLVLLFKEPDGTQHNCILESPEGEPGLYFSRLVDNASVGEWTLSREVASVEFAVELGVLTVTLTGPNDETITYAGVQQL